MPLDRAGYAIRDFLHVDEFVATYAAMTTSQVVLAVVASFLVVAGNAGQLLILNLWVNAMGSIPPPFTVLTVSATTMAVGFCAALAVRCLLHMNAVSIRFLLSRKAVALSVVIGLCNASNGVLLVYATQPTPEILQALLLCTQVFWTLLFSKLCLKTNQNILHPLVLLSFVLVAGGIVLGAEPQFGSSAPTNSNTKYWTMIFALSMIPGALYNVFASMYMRSFTHTEDEQVGTDPVFPQAAVGGPVIEVRYYQPTSATPLSGQQPLLTGKTATGTTSINPSYMDLPLPIASPATAVVRSDDTTVKLTMLATTGISQVIWMFVFLPLDSAPWFGSSPSIAATRSALSDGWACVLERKFGCDHTFAYYIGFNVAYFLNYTGSAYLNHFSATLNSMVTQISAPVASAVLIAFPMLNVAGQTVAIGPCVGAIILLLLGSSMYTLWEQGSRRRVQ